MASKEKARTDGRGAVYKEQLPRRPVRYVAQIYINGKKVRRVFPDRSQAEDGLELLRQEKKAGKDFLARQPTLSEWRKTCQAEHLGHLRLNVLEDYDSIGRTHIDSASIGAKKLDELTHKMCQLWLDKIAKTGRAYNTVRNARTLLHKILKIAKRERLITSNPGEELVISLPAIYENS
jgi:hypothetical protein